MASNANSNDFKIRVVDFAEHIFDYITLSADSQNYWVKVIALSIVLIIVLLLFYLSFKLVKKCIEMGLTLLEAYRKGRYRVVVRAEQRRIVRRRQQFCMVLDSDLSSIAKAENWNDQYFTDLEAEVETEGGYYASALDKIAKKKFYGMRRVSSLIKAIDTSTERAVLLVGEPGSGKSVALRHLAKQLANRGVKSKDPNIPIPLYLNLRELEVSEDEVVNADLIKRFVLENIRRGDADTSSYVKDNWMENKENGSWLFLFDSFDEIPAVLHAATDSQAVKIYSDAIRMFLDGQGECRSVLASREYKGPQALPWKKFTILKLSEKKQSELVENSFLPPGKIEIIKQYLANDRNMLANSPLFLSLLCRHFKDTDTPPTNDHQLLLTHILRLAAREPEHIEKKYKLTTEKLVSGARMLAIAFAKNQELSLAPKIDEISRALGDSAISPDDLQDLISALVDVKIGRNDVATARKGDRRFAFAHRRYQETLFADYLASNPSYIEPKDLLTLPQWREYAVALLQSQNSDVILPIIKAAISVIEEDASSQQVVLPEYADQLTVGYYNWTGMKSIAVLEALQEGLGKRKDLIIPELSKSIYRLLSPRMIYGDSIDNYMVIKLGGLLPLDVLTLYLGDALKNNFQNEVSEIALRQCVFLSQTSEDLNKQICKKMATLTLSAHNNTLTLRASALAAQLPNSLGIAVVVKRCAKLRPILSFLSTLSLMVLFPNWIINYLLKRMNIKNDFTESLQRILPSSTYAGGAEWMTVFIFIPVLFISALFSSMLQLELKESKDIIVLNKEILFYYILLPMLAIFLSLSMMYLHRDTPHRITLRDILGMKLSKLSKDARFTIMAGLGSLGFMLLVPAALGNSVYYIVRLFNNEFFLNSPALKIGFPLLGGIVLLGLITVAVKRYQIKKDRIKRFAEIASINSKDYEIFLSAENSQEAGDWLYIYPEFLSSDLKQIRSASAVVWGWQKSDAERYSGHRPLLRTAIIPTARLLSLLWKRSKTAFDGSRAHE
ncbi:hypothetical protein J2X54_001323 [Duganella sp. 3397]|uniref:NACHT domain-containing protein n=1 Tax=Duganella sp. 3397 TaxID=2817732 RepID=UPI0028567CF6|nr:NACHT domain-containing protein [Duganella sp. 3397]MDR7048875.1 hypothetical protein [Duganella sp. 3397]